MGRVISKGHKVPGYVIGGLIVTATGINLIYIQPETWFMFADGITVLVAFWLGMKISGKKKLQHEN